MLASFLNLSVRILFSIMLEFLLVLPSFLGFLGNGFLALFLLSCSLPSPLEDLALPYPALGPDEFLADLPTPWLDNNHTVFGIVVDEENQKVVDSIKQGDIIENIGITDDNFKFNKEVSDTIEIWNDLLSQ